MRNWILISIVTIILAVGALAAAQEDAKQLAAKGHSVFLQVLGGDESKLPEAIRYMEDARQLDPTNVNNLYNLGRVRFFEVITLGRQESLAKAEEMFARIMELDPKKTEALSFHGSVLTQQGMDINLPAETKKTTDVTPDISQIVLNYEADKRISINKQDVTVQELETRLRNIFDQRKDKTMFIMGAGSLRYKDIIFVIDAAKGAGVDKVGIVTEGMRRAGGAAGSN